MISYIKRNYKLMSLNILLLAFQSICVASSAYFLSKSINIITVNKSLAFKLITYFAILKLFESIFFYLSNWVELKLKFQEKLLQRNNIFNIIYQNDIKEFYRNKESYYLNYIVDQIDVYENMFLNNYYNAVYFFFLIIFSLVSAFKVSPFLAMLIALSIIFSLIIFKNSDKYYEKIENNFSLATKRYLEDIAEATDGIFTVFMNKCQKYYMNKVFNNFNSFKKENFIFNKNNSKISRILVLPGFIIECLIIAILCINIRKGNIKIDSLVLYLNVGGLLLNASDNLFSSLSNMKFGVKALPKILINKENKNNQNIGISPQSIYPSTLELENLNFRYDNNLLFKDFNKKINLEKSTLIVARNGRGKSTLFKLIMNILDKESGTIKLNGKDSKNLKINDYISYMMQEGYIFSGTVEENIFLNKNINSDEKLRIIRRAALEDFIKNHGYNYMLEAGGINISGGEKKRIL